MPFSVTLLVSTAAAVAGKPGKASGWSVGGRVPAVVEPDPELHARANQLVATWCTAVAALAAVPLSGLGFNRLDRDLSLKVLSALAVYGFVLACVGRYPFERVRQLARR